MPIAYRWHMALFSREFIAVPDNRKNQLVFKWPDVSIRKFTRAIVNADEVALFVNTGQVVGTLGPGRHQIDAQEMPGLGALIDVLSGGNAYRAELYFVQVKEHVGFRFGGRIDDVQDPKSGQIVTLRVFGDYAVQVIDPVRLVTRLIGTVDLADPGMVEGWCGDQLLKAMRVAIARGVTRGEYPVLGLSAYSPDIEQGVTGVANQQLHDYGLAIARMGNFDVNLAPEDAERLKRLAKDITYTQLAGGFQQYAAGEMALGAGQGMALGGGGATEGGFLAAGLGLGAMQQQMAAQAAQTPPPPPPPPAQPAVAALPAAGVTCASCETVGPAGARFCASCGTQLPVARFCTGCGVELAAGARFCGSCGTAAPD